MGCARFHDFVSGATITLITPDPDQSQTDERIDILRGDRRARALMAQHLRVLQELGRPASGGDGLH